MSERVVAAVQGKRCYDAARDKWGTGWKLLSIGQRYDAVTRQIVAWVMSLPADSFIPVGYIQDVAKESGRLIELESGREGFYTIEEV